jgi:uncharacterized membrane protein
MPFCVQCGNKVGGTDQFCGKCGTKQAAGAPGGATTQAAPDFMTGISNRNASLLCYIPMVGWVAAIVVLASERFRHETRVRFHAFQGIYLFVAWLMVEWVVRPALYISDWHNGFAMERTIFKLLQLVIFAGWVFMLIKVSHNEDYRLPIIGELADRSVCEQRS